MKHEGWPSGLSDRTASLLDRYVELLLDYAIPRGIVAAADAGALRARHVADSLRAVPLLAAGDLVDLGSGAGLPGIPVAIAAPAVHAVLAESRRTRIAFLELVIDDLGLENAEVHGGRAEALPRAFGTALARGFGDLATCWTTASKLLTDEGRLVYWAGASFDVRTDVPSGARVVVADRPDLESEGPLVIMARQ